MSKYEQFIIMKTYAFLIIFDFIQLSICKFDINITEDYVCPVQHARAKRAYEDYTRWETNQETTNEFLVKVLDDDLITSRTKPIVAVNIQPLTEKDDKIIIGANINNIPLLTPLTPVATDAREYTRFGPPTTVKGREIDIAPITPALITESTTTTHSLEPQGYLSQRDDSPPASPQFITRTPTLVARQYAPIGAVAFSRRTDIAPVTPTMPVFHTFTPPSRSWTPEPLTIPTRFKHDFEDLKTNQIFDEDTVTLDYITRTISASLKRTSDFIITNAINVDQEYEPTTRNPIEYSRRMLEAPIKEEDKASDASYNMMFYNDDDTIGSKNEDADVGSGDYYKNIEGDSAESDFSDTKQVTGDNENKNESTKDTQSDLDEYVADNITGKVLAKGVIGLPNVKTPTVSEKSRNKRRHPVCDLIQLRQLSFNSPRTLPEIFNQLKMWAEESPVAKWVDITEGNFTTMENPIYMMIVDDPSSGQIANAKQTVMIVAGIQGRDHHAVSAALYVLYQLIERSEAHSDLLTKYRFWIIPVFNPDGYDYSMSFPNRREWTKNLRQQWEACKGRDICKTCETHGLRCTIQSCYGVNLDRNFEYQWIPAEELRAEHPCGNLYAGTRQLSEIETHALTHYLHEKHTMLSTFIAFKEGDVLGVMYPYSHTRKKRAFDHVYRHRASRAAAAAYKISNRPYVAGQTSEFLPLYAGGIEDWVDGHLGIDNTYTIMMFRPSESYSKKLITERIAHETYAAMDTLLLQSLEPLGPAPAVLVQEATASSAHIIISTCLHVYIIFVQFILQLYG